MKRIIKLGTDPLNRRQLFFLELVEPGELPNQLALPSPNFYCFIAWDSQAAEVEEISHLAEALIKAGAAYFCTLGPGCERVHDIKDALDSEPFNDIGSPDDSVIMTTWHAKEPLEKALHFFLNSTWVEQHYEATSLCSLAISVGSKEWSRTITAALRAPREFSESVESQRQTA
jgi:hypothetical protein